MNSYNHQYGSITELEIFTRSISVSDSEPILFRIPPSGFYDDPIYLNTQQLQSYIHRVFGFNVTINDKMFVNVQQVREIEEFFDTEVSSEVRELVDSSTTSELF